MMLQILCHFIILQITGSISVDSIIKTYKINIPGHFHWTHHSVGSKVLYCPNCCREGCTNLPINILTFTTDQNTLCCIANAKPFWNFWNNLTVPLELKFNYSEHTVLAGINASTATVYVLKNNDGNMTIFPDNMCKFPRLVEIELKNNEIKELINLSCLNFLDYLNLDYNKIKTIRSSSFSGLVYLRYLSLSHNLITDLEPGTLKYRPGSLAFINIESNALPTLDISNVLLGYFFYEVSFDGNRIYQLTNKLNWTGFTEGDTIGGGIISVRNNNFTRVPSLSELRINSYDLLFKGSFNYPINLNNNPLSCDCEAYPYLLFMSHASLYYSSSSFVCSSPPILQGYSPKMFREYANSWKYLICNVSLSDKCPPKCYCYKQPSEKRVVVNCSSSNHSFMPKTMPDFDDIDIDLSHNMIMRFENLYFLNRTQRIDLSYNLITFVDPAVFGIKKLSFINLAYNHITNLERSVQLKNPCELWFGNVTLSKCNCEMLWIKDWLERQTLQQCEVKNVMTCQQNDKKIYLILLSEGDLCPTQQYNIIYCWFAVAIFSMLIFGILYYNFRYEIKLIFRNIKSYLHCNKHSKDGYEYDLYISFNMDNDDVRNWTMRTLRTFLEHQGYTICLPPRDFNFGAIHVEEISTKIASSKSFVVVLSQDYEHSLFQNIEWKHIWHTFITDSMTSITVINYDFLKSKEILDQKLKSFIRLGYSLNFDNFHKDLLNDIQVNIGSPIHHETAVFYVP